MYCASSQDVDPKYLAAARETGRLIALSGRPLISGGGVFGLMAASIEGTLEAGGTAVGVLPGFMMSRGWAHPRLSETIVTETMYERKRTLASLSQAAIALPGGIGTLDELMELMTRRQLGLYDGPVVIVNTDGYYDPLIDMFARMIDQRFMRDGKLHAFIASTPSEAMDAIERELASGGHT